MEEYPRFGKIVSCPPSLTGQSPSIGVFADAIFAARKCGGDRTLVSKDGH
jgi:hypothetical protein